MSTKISTTEGLGINEVSSSLYSMINDLVQIYCSKCQEFSCANCSVDQIMPSLKIKKDKVVMEQKEQVKE